MEEEECSMDPEKAEAESFVSLSMQGTTDHVLILNLTPQLDVHPQGYGSAPGRMELWFFLLYSRLFQVLKTALVRQRVTHLSTVSDLLTGFCHASYIFLSGISSAASLLQ